MGYFLFAHVFLNSVLFPLKFHPTNGEEKRERSETVVPLEKPPLNPTKTSLTKEVVSNRGKFI